VILFPRSYNIEDPDLVERLHGEIYQLDAMLEAHEEISKLPRLMDDTLKRVVAPLMVWSDLTQLANFGTASLWPFYLYFGNQSKYTRRKPTTNACHHLAYLPTGSPQQLVCSHVEGVDVVGENA